MEMNPLFLGLLAAGVALVAIVILYNWAQERRARRRIESAFGQPPDAQVERERVEPQLRAGQTAASSAAIQTDEPDDVPPPPSAAVAEPLPDVLPATRAERPGTRSSQSAKSAAKRASGSAGKCTCGSTLP